MGKKNEGSGSYILTGMIFTASARRLARSFAKDGEPITKNPQAVPLYYLVSHAAELFLKALVLGHGLPIQQKHNHDLMGLLGEAEKFGLKVSARTRKVLEELSPVHKQHSLRYSVFIVEKVVFQSTEQEVFEMLKELQRLRMKMGTSTTAERAERLP
jgi:HEPN domain-containing protein